MLWFKVILVGVWIHLLVMVGGCFAIGVISVWGFIVYEVIFNIFIWSSFYLVFIGPRKGGEQ